MAKKSWSKAPQTVKDFGQRQTNSMLRSLFGETCTSADLDTFQKKYGFYPFYIRKDKNYRLGTGHYRIPTMNEPLSTYGPQGEGAKVVHVTSPDAGSIEVNPDDVLLMDADTEPDTETPGAFKNDTNFTASDITLRLQRLEHEASMLATVPEKLKSFVPYGDYDMIYGLIESRKFMSVFITGLTGCGKTIFPEQACAALGRECISADITSETDEDDLIGGFRLRNNETYFELGPVVVAMIRGAVLVINELDLASPKIMCLQSVADGKPLTIKKLGVTIKAKEGFTIFATANTKGRGDDDGKYIGTGLLNEAFLARFPVWIEQQYPSLEVEQTILTKTFLAEGHTLTPTVKGYIDALAGWSKNIRDAYAESAADEVMPTRQLCQIIRLFCALGVHDNRNQVRAINYSLKRFDGKTQSQFRDLYVKYVDSKGPSNVGKAPSKPPTF